MPHLPLSRCTLEGVSDSFGEASIGRKIGRGFARAMAAIFGPRTLRRLGESADVLADAYREGRRDGEQAEPPPKPIPHRTLRSVTGPEAPPPSPEGP